MTTSGPNTGFLLHAHLQALIDVLREKGYACIGPRLRDKGIHFEPIDSASQLPRGVETHQAPGEYRASTSGRQRYFAWANGAQALKPLLFAAREPLWESHRDDDGQLHFRPCLPETTALAVIGVRACDIAALYLHDKHSLQQSARDPRYLARRRDLLLVAVNCTHPADTCFCASTGDGPAVRYGHDILLSELDEGFVAKAHTERGKAILERLPLEAVSAERQAAAEAAVAAAAARQTRRLPSPATQRALLDRLDHPHWDDIAQRCLSCGNCTSVCPSCFCHSEHDEVALDGATSRHYRQWDSCFSAGHSYIHGITVRADTRLRYRQWLTHKLASWQAQYGRSGCVGCGRCIAWCPAGIDLTREVATLCGDDAHD